MNAWLLVAAGGALGALARYGISGWVQARAGTFFPWGTLAVNLSGSLLLGLLLALLQHTTSPPELRPLLAIGFLGAYTTFSTFSWETVTLLQDGDWMRATLYLGASLLLGLAAVLAGIALGTALVGGRP